MGHISPAMAMLAFTKMHGLGNDFVVIDARRRPIALTPEQVRAIADRRTGVGCDQLIIVEAPVNGNADAFMRIRNAGGGEVGACGNATRCVAAMLMTETGRRSARIATIAGDLVGERAGAGLVTVDMGEVTFRWSDIPLARETDTLALPITAGSLDAPVAVGIGNPHAVFFVEDAQAVALEQVGPLIEHNPLFPCGTNVEVAQTLSRDRIRMRVWERGAGITRACGTGACATVAAAVRRGLADRSASVVLDGGVLHIDYRDDGHIMMTGPAAISFVGQVDPSQLPA